jgi:hypothetical protein
MADVPSGLSLNPPEELKKKKKINNLSGIIQSVARIQSACVTSIKGSYKVLTLQVKLSCSKFLLDSRHSNPAVDTTKSAARTVDLCLFPRPEGGQHIQQPLVGL